MRLSGTSPFTILCAADLVVAPDHGIELPLARALGEIERVPGQGLALRFVGLRRHGFPSPDLIHRLFKRLLRDAGGFQQPPRFALVGRGGEQEQLRGNVLIAALLGFLVGDVQQLGELAGDVHLPRRRAFHSWQFLYGFRKSSLQKRRICARLADQGGGAAVLLAEQRGEKVLGLDVLMVVAERGALRLGEGFLQLGRELFEPHRADPYGL